MPELPCLTGLVPNTHCHRGGIGCPLAHPDDDADAIRCTPVFPPNYPKGVAIKVTIEVLG